MVNENVKVNQPDEKWKETLYLILKQVILDKFAELKKLKHFENAISSIKGAEEFKSKEKRLCYRIIFGNEELRISFMASTVFLEPSDGTDFYFIDKYGLWDGDLDEHGNILSLRFTARKKYGTEFGECEEIVFDNINGQII
ncbi:MAG TPA: hypothetical protein VNB22_20150 [Pyrinomonadaceae bacterium]|nr:hypothetical protein [Pyrinomonadaceae bacterium]